MQQIQHKAMTLDDKNHIGYYKKLGAQELSEGLNVPNFEIVKEYKMVKNAICIRYADQVRDGMVYSVKHYDTIILQWIELSEGGYIFDKFEYNCSPTSNRQIDEIMCTSFKDIPRSEYTKIPAYHDRKNEFKGSLAWKC